MPDALIPHLRTTLSMDWDRPPAAVERALEAVEHAPVPDPSSVLDVVARRGPPGPGAAEPPLAFVRRHAARRSPITFPRMQQLQALLLGEPRPAFRTGPAYVTARAERYAWFPQAEAMFRTKVAHDDHDGCHPLVKAARLYLDLLYFHPFADGNARAALWWTVFHGLRADLPLPDPRRLMGFHFTTGHPDAYWALVLVLANACLPP